MNLYSAISRLTIVFCLPVLLLNMSSTAEAGKKTGSNSRRVTKETIRSWCFGCFTSREIEYSPPLSRRDPQRRPSNSSTSSQASYKSTSSEFPLSSGDVPTHPAIEEVTPLHSSLPRPATPIAQRSPEEERVRELLEQAETEYNTLPGLLRAAIFAGQSVYPYLPNLPRLTHRQFQYLVHTSADAAKTGIDYYVIYKNLLEAQEAYDALTRQDLEHLGH